MVAAGPHECMIHTINCMYGKIASWRWTARLFETCRGCYQNKIQESASRWFYYTTFNYLWFSAWYMIRYDMAVWFLNFFLRPLSQTVDRVLEVPPASVWIPPRIADCSWYPIPNWRFDTTLNCYLLPIPTPRAVFESAIFVFKWLESVWATVLIDLPLDL